MDLSGSCSFIGTTTTGLSTITVLQSNSATKQLQSRLKVFYHIIKLKRASSPLTPNCQHPPLSLHWSTPQKHHQQSLYLILPQNYFFVTHTGCYLEITKKYHQNSKPFRLYDCLPTCNTLIFQKLSSVKLLDMPQISQTLQHEVQ